MRKGTPLAFLTGLLLLTGCDMNQPPPGGELTEWALGQANDALEQFSDEYGDEILQAIDDFQNTGHPGSPFENNLDSARAYLLAQLQEKYGIEFMVVGDEDLVNYGPFAGATYTCEAAPVNAPEQTTIALVSQTLYQDVRDSYAVYFFKEEAEAPVLEFCGTKDYVLDQRITLEMPETPQAWTPADGLEKFLSKSGAYVQLQLRLADNLDTRTYAEQIVDFLSGTGQLGCNLSIQAKANGTTIFFSEAKILEGFDAASYSLEEVERMVDRRLKTGDPQ